MGCSVAHIVMDIFQGIFPISSDLARIDTNEISKDDIRFYLNQLWHLILKQDSPVINLNDLSKCLIIGIEYRDRVLEELRTIFKTTSSAEGEATSKAHVNIIFSLKMISVYLINNLTTCTEGSNEYNAILGIVISIIYILLSLVPESFDFVIFIDIITDLAKISPIRFIGIIVNNLYSNLNILRNHYLDMETRYVTKRRMQTAGAKLIFFVKSIENRMIYTDYITYPELSFQLRCILIECLSMSHLGISNKHGLNQIQTLFTTTESEVFKCLEEFVQRPPCETIEEYTDDINGNYKYKVCNFEPILKLPDYKIYTSFKIALSFSQFSEDMSLKDESYYSQLLESYQALLNFYRTLNPNARVKGPLHAWYKDGIDMGNGIIFSMVCNDMDFWKQFIVESFMALMDLYRITKPLNPDEEYLCLFNRISNIVFQPDKESIYSKQPTKTRAIINEIQKILVKFSAKINGFTKFLTTLLATEAQWVYWKRNGCLELLDNSQPSIDHIENDDQLMKFIDADKQGWIIRLKDYLENENDGGIPGVKRVAIQRGDEISRLSCKFTYESALRVDPINLTRQANEWGLEINDGVQDTLEAKLGIKLNEYREKMKIDLDPENQVETPSSEDNIFRFRLGKLFTMQYMDKLVGSTCKLLNSNTCDNMECLMTILDQTTS